MNQVEEKNQQLEAAEEVEVTVPQQEGRKLNKKKLAKIGLIGGAVGGAVGLATIAVQAIIKNKK